MRWTVVFLPLVVLVIILCWGGCQALVFSLRYPGLVADANNRLQTMSQRLPTPPGSSLIQQVDTTGGGATLECDTRGIDKLYGTNDMTFAAVLDFYSSSLQSAGWQSKLATNSARTFRMDGEFNLEVSDLYDASMISKSAIEDGQSKFKTLFMLGLNTPILVPPPQECRQN